MTIHADLILYPRWVLPIVPADTLLERHAVVVSNGEIIAICPFEETSRYQAAETLHLDQQVLIPGLVNLHTHAAMSLLRGLADDLALMPWLEQHIWPAERQLVSPDFVYDGTLLACAEMLSGGVTTCNDMYFFPDAAARAVKKIGMRAHLGLVVLEFPTQYANDAESYIQQGLDARDQWRNEALISFSLAPHAPYTVADSTFRTISTLSEQLNIGVHTHLHETRHELEQSERSYGKRPLYRLADLGLLGPHMTFAHCVHMQEAEIKLLAEQNCSIAHCPSSNLKLASGIAPIAECVQRGVNIGLGTDGAASNNRLDMFTEMRTAALLAKGASGDATAVSAYRALEMATINGARALGLERKIGSIEVGKCADLVAIDLSEMQIQPCFDPASHLVYVAGREQVSHVWVNGALTYCKPEQSRGIFAHVEPSELQSVITKWNNQVKAFV